MPRYGTEPYAPKIKSEIDKIQRYLNSLRLIPNDKNMDVYILADKKTLDEFDEEKSSLPNINYRYLNVQEASASLGLEMGKTIPFSDQIFLMHLLQAEPKNYYASSRDMRYAKLRKMRIAMNLSSILILLTSLIYSGYTFMDGLLFKQQSEEAKIKSAFYQSRYQMAKERLPNTPVDSYKIKTAVEAAEVLDEYKSTPYEMLSMLGQTLKSFPEIQLDDVDWAFSTNLQVAANKNPTSRSQFESVPIDTGNENEYKYYQVSDIKAHILPFDGDYRKAIATVNQLAETLREQESVHTVIITSLPLDVSSSATLQGNTEINSGVAQFSLITVMGIN